MNIVSVEPIERINFAPSTEIDEILQNVATILSTVKNSVPYARAFGITADYLDDPTPITRAKLTADIIAQLRKYEPRAKVVEVLFKEDPLEGKLIPIARVGING